METERAHRDHGDFKLLVLVEFQLNIVGVWMFVVVSAYSPRSSPPHQ